MFGVPLWLISFGAKLGGGISAAFTWATGHPLQVAAVVAAVLLYFDHRALTATRADLAETCAAIAVDKPPCLDQIRNAVIVRDAYKRAFEVAAANENTAKAANATLKSALADAEATNAHNLETTQQAQQRAAAALAQLQRMRESIAASAAREAKLREQIYETDPTCNAWGDLPVCPGIDQRLRHRAP